MKLEENSKIATLGPRYSFHDIALEQYNLSLEVVYLSSFEEIFLALLHHEVSHALVAISNTIHGDIASNKVQIASHGFSVLEQLEVPITLHLAGKDKVDLKQISHVYAHPIAWQECQKFIKKYHLKHIPSRSNSQAIEDLIGDFAKNGAAISGKSAIKHYGLHILASNIHDQEPNVTTFLLISQKNHNNSCLIKNNK